MSRRTSRTFREDLVFAVAVVLLVASIVTGALAAIGPVGPALGSSIDSLCFTAPEPAEVVASRIASRSEGVTPFAQISTFPYGPSCTWALPDGRVVTSGPGWGATITMGVAGGIALATSWHLLVGTRRSRGPRR